MDTDAGTTVVTNTTINLPEDPKMWYESKTLWTNLIAAVAIIVQKYTHFVIDPMVQGAILMIVNVVLRAITNKPIAWTQTQLLKMKTPVIR